MKRSVVPDGSRRRSGHPALAGIIIGIVMAAAAIALIIGLPSIGHQSRASGTTALPAVAAPPAPAASDLAFDGTLVARTEWTDHTGSHVVILSRTASALQARHYRESPGGPVLVAEHVEPLPADTYAAGFYRDGVWASDLVGDGNQEALFACYVDASPDPGPKRLALFVFAGDGLLSMSGSTRYDPAIGERVAPIATSDDAMRAAPAGIQAEAARLWSEAQFDLAEPEAFAGFFKVMRLDGATFHGDGPAWDMVVLPQYVLFKYAGAESYSMIHYASIATADTSVIMEGSGEVEAWNHKFRITIAEEPVVAPHGESYPYTVTIDWSDGTRLHGWGAPAAPSS